MLDVQKVLMMLLGDFIVEEYKRRQEPPIELIRPDRLTAWQKHYMQHKEEDIAADEAMHTYIRGMIAAAAADGRVTDMERQRIMVQMDRYGLSDREQRFIMTELESPLLVPDLVARVSGPEMARKLYAASVSAIFRASNDHLRYLAHLAEELGVPAATVREIHEHFEVPLPEAFA